MIVIFKENRLKKLINSQIKILLVITILFLFFYLVIETQKTIFELICIYLFTAFTVPLSCKDLKIVIDNQLQVFEFYDRSPLNGTKKVKIPIEDLSFKMNKKNFLYYILNKSDVLIFNKSKKIADINTLQFFEKSKELEEFINQHK